MSEGEVDLGRVVGRNGKWVVGSMVKSDRIVVELRMRGVE